MSAMTDLLAHCSLTIITINGDVDQIVISPSGATAEEIAAATQVDADLTALAAKVHALVPVPPTA